MNKQQPLQDLELALLLEGIQQYYGYDFRRYASASVKRRIDRFMEKEGRWQHISELIPAILYDRSLFVRFLEALSVVVTEMFRDPDFFLLLREKVIPVLKTYPFIKIWHAGCASGQEVYSMAILLEEEGLLDRCCIYATDINDAALTTAVAGKYPTCDMPLYEKNYRAAGGKKSLQDYMPKRGSYRVMADFLSDKIVFSDHNLATDSSFGSMNLVMCRNVLIYFDEQLQAQVVRLLVDSLDPLGVLCIGKQETVHICESFSRLAVMDVEQRLYQKK
ncbi:Chemotaxis protein methyltransferase [invertebrate metagenome]|uniref:Chemotaxis protein methyltransferase n=1 Tax=invertebrate metagenome TaxID=1711999 RepID=A0A2H9TB48_9ZZZZ